MQMIEKMLDGLEELKFSYFLTIANTGCETMNHIMDHIYQEVAGAIDKCSEIIKEVAQEYNNGWIPCSERLPEENENVLVACDLYEEEKRMIVTSIFYGCEEYHPEGVWEVHAIGKPVAWMPLPEPYQPKGE